MFIPKCRQFEREFGHCTFGRGGKDGTFARPMNRSRLAKRAKVCAVLHLATLLVAVLPARAEPPASAAPPARVTDSVLEALGRLPRHEGVEALVRALEGGLSDGQTAVALRALGRQGGPRAISALAPYTQHRRPEARQVAYEALAESGAAQAPAALISGLSDASAEVRARCAQLLRGFPSDATRAALRRALTRGVAEAASSLAAVVPDAQLSELTADLTPFPIELQLSAYRTAYLRKDLSEATKASLIASIMEIGTPPARALLVGLLKAGPSRASKSLREALLRAIRRLASPEDGVQ